LFARFVILEWPDRFPRAKPNDLVGSYGVLAETHDGETPASRPRTAKWGEENLKCDITVASNVFDILWWDAPVCPRVPR